MGVFRNRIRSFVRTAISRFAEISASISFCGRWRSRPCWQQKRLGTSRWRTGPGNIGITCATSFRMGLRGATQLLLHQSLCGAARLLLATFPTWQLLRSRLPLHPDRCHTVSSDTPVHAPKRRHGLTCPRLQGGWEIRPRWDILRLGEGCSRRISSARPLRRWAGDTCVDSFRRKLRRLVPCLAVRLLRQPRGGRASIGGGRHRSISGGRPLLASGLKQINVGPGRRR